MFLPPDLATGRRLSPRRLLPAIPAGAGRGMSVGETGCLQEPPGLPPAAGIPGLLTTRRQCPGLTATCAESGTTSHLSFPYRVVESAQISRLCLLLCCSLCS